MNKREKTEAKFLKQIAKETGLSGALLCYAFHFGIMGIVQKKRKRRIKK